MYTMFAIYLLGGARDEGRSAATFRQPFSAQQAHAGVTFIMLKTVFKRWCWLGFYFILLERGTKNAALKKLHPYDKNCIYWSSHVCNSLQVVYYGECTHMLVSNVR